MERFTTSIDETPALEFDRLIEQRGYRNRSEAVRDLLRGYLERERLERDESAHCVANLSYVYNHHERELAERGVRHGQINLVSVEVDHGQHGHGYVLAGKAAPHLHLKPKT